MIGLWFATLNAWNDWQEQQVFDVLNLGLLVSSIFYWILTQMSGGDLIVLVISQLVMAILAWKTATIRSGDVFFLIGCSFLVGSSKFLWLIILAALLGGLYGFYLLVRRKLTWETTIAFTPFILLATILIL
ncbi:MAG: prepilin peptidase [Culicoidibacterales bacterium]